MEKTTLGIVDKTVIFFLKSRQTVILNITTMLMVNNSSIILNW